MCTPSGRFQSRHFDPPKGLISTLIWGYKCYHLLDLKSNWRIMKPSLRAFIFRFAKCSMWVVHTKRQVLKQPFWSFESAHISRYFEDRNATVFRMSNPNSASWCSHPKFWKLFCKLFHLVCAHKAAGSETAIFTLQNGSIFTVIWGYECNGFLDLKFK